MNRSLGNDDTDSHAQSIGNQPTMQGGFREIRIGMKIGPDGRYLIKDILGKGGMGEVYLAFDEVSKTEVAIKLVPREVSTSEDEMEQVRKNFVLVRNLHHPNIAAVTALERLASGEYILVMEAVLGRRTLQKERLSRENERIPVPEAIQICRQIAEALDCAHKQSVIHRDVKPSNVLLAPDGQVKLTDFGLAAQIMSSMNRVSMLPTRTSGTRPYMAPEQWEGRIQDVRTDQWALAVLLYELVAGRLPFPADDLGVLERQILEKTPEKPIQLTDNQWSSIRRALSKEKEERFETCISFVNAVDRDERQRLPKRDKKRTTSLTLVLLLFLAAGVGVAAFQYFRPGKSTNAGVAAPTQAPAVESVPSGGQDRHQIDAERLAREQAEAKLRDQEATLQRAQQDAERLRKEKEQAEQARIAAEEAVRQQQAEAARLAREAETKRLRDAEEAARQRAAEAEKQRQLELARRINVSASFEEFPDGNPGLNGVDIEEARGVDKNPHYKKSMRFLGDGAYMVATFQVQEVPRNAKLNVVHLSSASAGARNGGWSPVTITINGSTVVADHSPSSHGYMTESWDVQSLLRKGKNSIKFYFDNSQTHYWLQSFEIVGQ